MGRSLYDILEERIVRTEVTIDGVKLTAEQVRRAFAELQKPETPTLTNLMRVQRRRCGFGHPLEGVIIIGTVQRQYASAYHYTGKYTVVSADGGGWTYNTPEDLLDTWEPVK